MDERATPLPSAGSALPETPAADAPPPGPGRERFLFVFMDLNNKCNLRCRMCHFARDLKDVPPVTMGLPLFEKIAAQVFPKATQVNLSCGAEPLIIPNFLDYLRIVPRYRVPVVGIVTNGTRLNEAIIAGLFETDVANVEISIDGATAATYERIRRGADFAALLKRISLLQDLKERAGRSLPRLHLNYTLMRSNIAEFPEFIRLAERLRADSVRATHLIPFATLGIAEESLGLYRRETNAVLQEARLLAQERGMNVVMPPDFDLAEQEGGELAFNKPQCRIPDMSMCIISDGRVVPCSWFSLQEWCAGNFQVQDFDEIWEGRVYRTVRERIRRSEHPADCRNCPVWGNEALGTYRFVEKGRKDVFNISPGPV